MYLLYCIITMEHPTNVQITRINDMRFAFEDKWVTPRSEERERRRNQKVPISEEEAAVWAAELDTLCVQNKSGIDRGGWRMLQEYKMGEEYNRWHTLDDHLDYGALLRGIHNIQERGGNGAAEKRFLDRVCDRFGHERF